MASSEYPRDPLQGDDPFFPLNWEHDKQDDSYRVVGGYQRNELFLFTTRELKDLDAVCDRPLKKSTLTPGIIPLLRRDRWEDRPSTAWLRTDSIPIRGDPQGGKWQSSNDRVWDVLKPIVTLASKYIMSSKNLPWLDALLLGPRRPVVQDRYPPGAKIQKEFHTFHPREGPWTAEREREVETERERVFIGLMNEMDFMFSYFYSHQNARDNDPPNHDPNYPVKKWGDPLGVTTVNAWEMVVKKVPGAKVCGTQRHVCLFEVLCVLFFVLDQNLSSQWRVQTFINVQALEALFFDSDDLSDSEAAALRFRCATTMHGGIDSKRPSNHRSRRILTQFAEVQFPSFTSKSHAASGQAVLIDPPIQNWSDFHPIGVQFLEDVHNQDFWDLMVRSFGGRILQYQTIKEGTRIFYEPGSYRPFTILKGDRLDPVSHDPYENDEALMVNTMLDVKARMTHTPAEKKLMAFVTKIAESAKTGKAFWKGMESQLRTVRDIIQVLVQRERVDLIETFWKRFGRKFKEGELGRKLNVSYNILEKCQALLFVPSQKGVESNYPLEQKEFDMLMETATTIHLQKDFETGKQMCLKLLSDRYIGSFVKSAAKFLIASCEAESAGDVDKLSLPLRHKCWKAAEQGLERLIWLHEEVTRSSDGWQAAFDDYIKWGGSLVAKFTIVAATVLPEGVEHMEDVQLTGGNAGRLGRVETRKRTRSEIEDWVNDEMEDVIYTNPEEWQSAANFRKYKKMKLLIQNPGKTPPE
ncbi:predicted protein [Sclerotinia sclerotiorum 1980 UF-70]|uniref:Uncharacterized protein n=1 Tax=Sclerotinia sclerotiorum (strain ATCC 18683 / 1980 / Ss-1) TaxID=665079 RepID=A7EV73_SCLS1|nr:predicted protein [Sclerotinia sclerotiorum 1980 UF-70]EDN93365.1 predicted protein [Sclerotinia sclerotiorum 1980 UF-70]